MKRYHDLSVKVKIPIMLGIASLLVFSLICILLMKPLRTSSLEDSSQIAKDAAELAGEQLAVVINASASIMPARASVIAGLIQTDFVRQEDKRKMMMDDMVTLVVSEATAVTNAWVILEPNALDGMDSQYIHQPGSTGQGNVSARWHSSGKISSADYETNNNLYRQVKQSRQGMMSQPYQDELDGKKVWMVAAVAPIMQGGNFYGVVATEYDLTGMCELVNSLNTIGEGQLVTDKGYIVAHRDQTRLGALAEFGNRKILDKLADGKAFEGFFTVNDVESYKVYVPIRLGTSVKPWFYAVDVPSEKIYKKAREVAKMLILFFIAGVFLIAVFGYFMIRPMLVSVIGVTGIIRQLSLGRINLQIGESQSKDEIGTMKSELNHLLGGLKNTAGFAQNIGKGDLNAEYQMLSDDDVLGNSLLDMRQSLQNAEKEQSIRAREEEHRNWVTAGLAKFAEILRRDNNNLEALSYNVISNMVKYLGINQGGIFILNETENEENRVLEMKACYAFDRKKFAEKNIRPGEGLVGTCYLEGEAMYMTDVPNEYITITSGLGDANPSALLISPLKVNDQIFGVIELASFHPFEPYQLEFVQKVSESIAATISTVNVNIRTNRLLEQTKLQAEEMVNQEEELRQNMEEMQATQEESRRREIELQEILEKMKSQEEELRQNMEEIHATQEEMRQKELETEQFLNAIYQTCNVVEFSSEAIITDVNQNLCNIFGVDRSAFIGKHVTSFISQEAFQAANNSIMNGKIHEDVQRVKVGDDKSKDIIQKFVPINDKDGKLLRVLMLAFPKNS